MISSIASLIFGASEDYSGVAELHAGPLKTTPTEDEWLLVDRSDETESMSCEEQFNQCSVPDTMSSSTTSCHSVTLTTDSNESESPHHKPSSRPRGGNTSWLVTPPPCFTLGNTVSGSSESNPLEDLLIEHPSMSVYGGSMSTSARGRPRDNTQQQSQQGQQVATTAAQPAVRSCLSTRSEHYNLRKSTMQKSKASKKQNTKKAFQRQNHTTHFITKNHNRQTAMRPVTFQPRK